MSKGKRYTQEFKIEAVKQTNERGYSVTEVSERLGICTKTLYHWRSQLSEKPKPVKAPDERLMIAKLEAEACWIHQDLREVGEKCSVNRVVKIMRKHKLKAQIGYKRKYIKGGSTSRIADNMLKRQFNPPEPNQVWVSDITYIRTHEGFLYLATVMDLFSRRIVGWSMDKNMDKQLVINALLMAVYQRQPKTESYGT